MAKKNYILEHFHDYKLKAQQQTQQSHQGLTVKSLSATRWLARADAIKALHEGYATIKSSLQDLADDDLQTADTRNEAESLVNSMGLTEIAILCGLWHSILTRFNATNKLLQKSDIDIKLAVDLLISLPTFGNYLRDKFDDFEAAAHNLSDTTEYRTSLSRKRRRTTRYVYDDSLTKKGGLKKLLLCRNLPVIQFRLHSTAHISSNNRCNPCSIDQKISSLHRSAQSF